MITLVSFARGWQVDGGHAAVFDFALGVALWPLALLFAVLQLIGGKK